MSDPRPTVPPVAWAYGLLGLIPFVVPAGAAMLHAPPGSQVWRQVLVVYAAVILSFLGGARWGLEIARRPVRPVVITLSMLPSVAGFLLALSPAAGGRVALGGLALAHGLQWLWDVRSAEVPAWYPRLRSVLAAGATLSLLTALAFG